MGTYEAINVVFTKIKNLDPENASKIIGYILGNLQETEIVRLASSPDHVLHSLVLKVKQHLGLSRPSTVINPNNSKFFPLLSQDSIHIGSVSKYSLSPPKKTEWNSIDALINKQLLGDLSFLDESPKHKENLEDWIGAGLEWGHKAHSKHSIGNNGNDPFHGRIYSTSNMHLGSEERGYKGCLYFDRGYCKNGSNCKFVHSTLTDAVDALVGPPSKFDEEIMQHQKSVATSNLRVEPSLSSYEKYFDFLMQLYKDAKRGAAVMMGDEFHKFSWCSPERNDFMNNVSAEKPNSPSRQIFLTFPAESTFKEEDVLEYFSKFGPVQDVTIPYQKKRMFGFVTFVYPETVKLVLSKENPHFISDSRVLVKPHKEKGKVLDKRQQHQQQQLERGESSSCLNSSRLDSKEPCDFHLGARRLHNPHEILLRRKLEEQTELQQAIELQKRRLMNLQLPDFKNDHIRSVGASLPLPQIHSNISNPGLSSDSIKGNITGFSDNLISTISSAAFAAQPQQEVDPACIHDTDNGNRKDSTVAEITNIWDSVEHALPDSLFSSPSMAGGDNLSDFSTLAEVNESDIFSTSSVSSYEFVPENTSSDMASH